MDWGKANACPLGGQDPFCAFSPEEEPWLTLCWKGQLCCDFHHNPCIYPRTFTKESLNSFPKTSVTLTIMSLDHTVHTVLFFLSQPPNMAPCLFSLLFLQPPTPSTSWLLFHPRKSSREIGEIRTYRIPLLPSNCKNNQTIFS